MKQKFHLIVAFFPCSHTVSANPESAANTFLEATYMVTTQGIAGP
jgi:hypothetical protein